MRRARRWRQRPSWPAPRPRSCWPCWAPAAMAATPWRRSAPIACWHWTASPPAATNPAPACNGCKRCMRPGPLRIGCLPTAGPTANWAGGLHCTPGWGSPPGGGEREGGGGFEVDTGVGLACGVVEVGAESLRIRASASDDWLCPHAPVMLLAPGLASTRLPFVGQGLRAAAPALPALPEPGIEDLGVQPGDPQSLALEEADLILAAGNGVRHGDLPLLHALAQEIGARVGASRVAVDAGHFARHQQIGATGKAVSASAYLALGISGAVQHLQGIKDCRHVIAVNLDASAPITGRAHLSVIEDSAALMQALIELVRKERDKAGA